MVQNLSGGMKRRLCVAIALIGHSEFIMLDEPTAGMDPISKRLLWNFLENQKHGSIFKSSIYMTTHF